MPNSLIFPFIPKWNFYQSIHFDKGLYNIIELRKVIMHMFIILDYYFNINLIYKITNIYEFCIFWVW